MAPAIRDADRKSLPELMRELVLDPAGMRRSTYAQPLPADRAAYAGDWDGPGTILSISQDGNLVLVNELECRRMKAGARDAGRAPGQLHCPVISLSP